MSAPVLPSLDKVDPVEAWRPWQPSEAQPWDLKWAGHLFRRAAFGATPAQLREAVDKGFQTTVDQLLRGDPQTTERDKPFWRDSERIARLGKPGALRAWWLGQMLRGPYPLREKMCLFWHNHFATSIVKVQDTELMVQQNELIRRHALGKFRQLLLDMSRDAASLVWLDSNRNVQGAPNENYARELMELFSLGVGHYTEKDIRAAARAFTGWHTDGGTGYKFNAAAHDSGRKTILGQSGPWNGDDVVRIVLEQPAAPLFLTRKLYRYLISEAEDPPDALLQPLADSFRKSDYDVVLLVQTMLGSRHFFSGHAYRQRIKSPVEFTLDACQAVGQGFVLAEALVTRLQAMGQELFAPPNVKGWQHGQSWLNTATMLARHNFAQALALGLTELNREAMSNFPDIVIASAVDVAAPIRRQRITEPERIVAFFVDALMNGDVRESVRKKLIAFLTEGKSEGDARDQRIREMVHALMTTSEYQLA